MTVGFLECQKLQMAKKDKQGQDATFESTRTTMLHKDMQDYL